MGFLDLFKKQKPVKALPSASKKSFFATIASQLSIGGRSGFESAAEQGFNRNPYIFACVDQRASNFASLPISIEDNDRQIDNHDILMLLKNAVYNNERISQHDFLYMISAFLDLAGSVYIWGDDIKRPSELVLLSPSDVEVRDFNGSVIYRIGQKVINQEQEFFLHLKGFNPLSKVLGLSPANSCSLSIDTNNAGRTYNASLMEKHTKISAWIKGNAGEIPAEMREQFRQEFKQKAGGATNAGDVVFISGDIDVVEGQMKPVDMDWLNAMELSGKEIAMAYKVPLELLGVGRATYENVKEAKLGFMIQTVLPQMQKLLTALEMKLLPDGKLKLLVDLDDVELIQKARQEAKHKELTAKAAHATQLYQAGIITQNEAREVLGLDRLGGGDIIKPSFMLTADPQQAKIKLPNVTETRANIERFRNSESRSLSGKISSEFKTQYKNIQTALQNANGDLDLFKTLMTDYLQSRQESFSAILDQGKMQAIKNIGGFQVRELEKQLASRNVKVDFEFDSFTEAVSDWVFAQTADKVVGVNRHTKNLIADIVQKQINLGGSIVDTASDIDELFLKQIIPNRSMVIARTEVIPALNFGVLEASKQVADRAGITLRKRWIASFDERTRDSHKKLHKATAANPILHSENFMLETDDGQFQKLRIPGDSTLGASAEETIQCRCAVAPVV